MRSPFLRMSRVNRRLLCLLFLSAAAAAAFAEAPVDPRIFAGKAAGESASFLVVLREQADVSSAEAIPDRVERIRFVYETLKSAAEVSQRALISRLSAAGVPFRSHFLVNMVEVEAPPAIAGELASRPDVSSLAANPAVRAPEPPRDIAPEQNRLSADAASTVEPNVALIGAPAVWARGFTGQGIVIAMADTGFTWDHPALKPHYRGFDGTSAVHDYNWHDSIHDPKPGNACGASTTAPCDDDGHGTSTASLAVGDDGLGNQVGVAPGAKFIGCRNMDRGEGTPARYTECFEFFLAPTDAAGRNPRPDLAPHVISNSWGCPDTEGCTEPEVLRSIVENVRAAGILVVVSAGNDGPNCSTIGIPATYSAALAVGATTLTDTIASFSSRGTVTDDGSNRVKPDVCAPGTGLRVAAMPTGYRGGFSGTSGSCPEVAGAAALLYSAVPALIGKPVSTAGILEQSAVRLTAAQACGGVDGTAIPNAVFGFGRIDVDAAVALASAPSPSRPAPVRRSPAARNPRTLSPRR
jgi:serine protease AprX